MGEDCEFPATAGWACRRAGSLHRNSEADRSARLDQGSSSTCVWVGLGSVGHLGGGTEGVRAALEGERGAAARNAADSAVGARGRRDGKKFCRRVAGKIVNVELLDAAGGYGGGAGVVFGEVIIESGGDDVSRRSGQRGEGQQETAKTYCCDDAFEMVHGLSW